MVDLFKLGYIPLDKSWIIRLGFLDLVNGYSDILGFLNSFPNLSDDLLALKRVVESWNTNSPLDVGESGTLYRFVKFFLWKTGKDRTIMRRGTLKEREICDNPSIINWPLRELLKEDNGTSQWASASVLLGNTEKIENPPAKLELTYEAVEHWKNRRVLRLPWTPRYDKTIERQALSFLSLLKTGKIEFVPEHSEDYCFARAFNLITREQGEKIFPSLRGHESNRLEEMEFELENLKNKKPLFSRDHRVIQAIVMLNEFKELNKELVIPNENAVLKSWPQFWDFVADARELSALV